MQIAITGVEKGKVESMHFLQVTEELRKLGKISRFKNKHNNAYNAPGRKSVANKMRNMFFSRAKTWDELQNPIKSSKIPWGSIGKKRLW